MTQEKVDYNSLFVRPNYLQGRMLQPCVFDVCGNQMQMLLCEKPSLILRSMELFDEPFYESEKDTGRQRGINIRYLPQLRIAIPAIINFERKNSEKILGFQYEYGLTYITSCVGRCI